LHGKEISFGSGLWIERDNQPYAYAESPRIGINYAGEWTKVPWRYTLLERLH
jgi:3-methyladenine DNA glycosylase Mpg